MRMLGAPRILRVLVAFPEIVAQPAAGRVETGAGQSLPDAACAEKSGVSEGPPVTFG
jgi:hypothetical protein